MAPTKGKKTPEQEAEERRQELMAYAFQDKDGKSYAVNANGDYAPAEGQPALSPKYQAMANKTAALVLLLSRIEHLTPDEQKSLWGRLTGKVDGTTTTLNGAAGAAFDEFKVSLTDLGIKIPGADTANFLGEVYDNVSFPIDLVGETIEAVRGIAKRLNTTTLTRNQALAIGTAHASLMQSSSEKHAQEGFMDHPLSWTMAGLQFCVSWICEKCGYEGEMLGLNKPGKSFSELYAAALVSDDIKHTKLAMKEFGKIGGQSGEKMGELLGNGGLIVTQDGANASVEVDENGGAATPDQVDNVDAALTNVAQNGQSGLDKITHAFTDGEYYQNSADTLKNASGYGVALAGVGAFNFARGVKRGYYQETYNTVKGPLGVFNHQGELHRDQIKLQGKQSKLFGLIKNDLEGDIQKTEAEIAKLEKKIGKASGDKKVDLQEKLAKKQTHLDKLEIKSTVVDERINLRFGEDANILDPNAKANEIVENQWGRQLLGKKLFTRQEYAEVTPGDWGLKRFHPARLGAMPGRFVGRQLAKLEEKLGLSDWRELERLRGEVNGRAKAEPLVNETKAIHDLEAAKIKSQTTEEHAALTKATAEKASIEANANASDYLKQEKAKGAAQEAYKAEYASTKAAAELQKAQEAFDTAASNPELPVAKGKFEAAKARLEAKIAKVEAKKNGSKANTNNAAATPDADASSAQATTNDAVQPVADQPEAQPKAAATENDGVTPVAEDAPAVVPTEEHVSKVTAPEENPFIEAGAEEPHNVKREAAPVEKTDEGVVQAKKEATPAEKPVTLKEATKRTIKKILNGNKKTDASGAAGNNGSSTTTVSDSSSNGVATKQATPSVETATPVNVDATKANSSTPAPTPSADGATSNTTTTLPVEQTVTSSTAPKASSPAPAPKPTATTTVTVIPVVEGNGGTFVVEGSSHHSSTTVVEGNNYTTHAEPHSATKTSSFALPVEEVSGGTYTVRNSAEAPAATAKNSNSTRGLGVVFGLQYAKQLAEMKAQGYEVTNMDVAGATLMTSAGAFELATGRTAETMLMQTFPKFKVGGPLVQTVIAAPMLVSAYKTGDTEIFGSTLGATTLGIGGTMATTTALTAAVSAGLIGQTAVPIPVVGFVAGVVLADGGAKVGGLAYTVWQNDDAKKVAEAKHELKRVAIEYGASPAGGVNLVGAATSSIGRAVTAIGDLSSYGGDKYSEFGQWQQKMADKFLPSWAAAGVKPMIAAQTYVSSGTLKVLSVPLKGIGTTVDVAGKSVEFAGHSANKAVDHFAHTLEKSYTQHHKSHNVVVAGALAHKDAVVSTYHKSVDALANKASEVKNTVSHKVDEAKSWAKSVLPSWMGGEEEKPAPQKPILMAEAKKPVPAKKPVEQADQGLEAAMLEKTLAAQGQARKVAFNSKVSTKVGAVNTHDDVKRLNTPLPKNVGAPAIV